MVLVDDSRRNHFQELLVIHSLEEVLLIRVEEDLDIVRGAFEFYVILCGLDFEQETALLGVNLALKGLLLASGG